MRVTPLTENHPTATPLRTPRAMWTTTTTPVYHADEEEDLIEILTNIYGLGRLIEIRGGGISHGCL